MKKLLLLITTVILTACGGSDGGGSSGAATGCQGCLTGTFTDASVTGFSQTSNIAKNEIPGKKILNFFIAEAYAAGGDGEISCFTGDPVDFTMTALGTETVNVTTTCDTVSNIVLAVRVALVESMNTSGKTVRLEYGESGLITNKLMDMNNFAWGTGFSVPNGKPGYENCNDRYTFHQTGTYAGRVLIQNDPANVIGAGAGQCNVGGGDEYATGYLTEVAFRFKDGNLEFDTDVSNGINFEPGDLNGNGANRPANIDYERWVIQ